MSESFQLSQTLRAFCEKKGCITGKQALYLLSSSEIKLQLKRNFDVEFSIFS